MPTWTPLLILDANGGFHPHESGATSLALPVGHVLDTVHMPCGASFRSVDHLHLRYAPGAAHATALQVIPHPVHTEAYLHGEGGGHGGLDVGENRRAEVSTRCAKQSVL